MPIFSLCLHKTQILTEAHGSAFVDGDSVLPFALGSNISVLKCSKSVLHCFRWTQGQQVNHIVWHEYNRILIGPQHGFLLFETEAGARVWALIRQRLLFALLLLLLLLVLLLARKLTFKAGKQLCVGWPFLAKQQVRF